MRIKYLVYPDKIPAGRLMYLYNVDARECIIIAGENGTRGLKGKYKILKPKDDGEYDTKLCEEVELK